MKSYSDLEQSKKLAEILPLESADMCYQYQKDRWIGEPAYKEYPQFEIAMDRRDIPCWSLAALLEVLPKGVKSPFGEINPFVGQVGIKDYRCVYHGDWDSNIQTFANNPVDACYEMIIKLHEENRLGL